MFHRNVFPKFCKISFPSPKLNLLCDPSHKFLEVTTFSPLNCSVTFCTTSIALVNIVFLATNFDAAMAQTPIASKEVQASAKTMSQVNVLFVNPSIGDDKATNAGERTPLKTITRALQSAKPNTVIILSKGTYSAESGERFPLMLKPGVSIQGDQGNKGRDIVITGGGDYLSRTFGGKNVTFVGADQAGLTGVTVTNSNRRGYGLWIEYTSPIVAGNTFIGNTQDGVSITGSSQASIRNNHFERNGANGITITGNSRPDVRENVFQQTGFGINIAQNAQPMLIGNRILGNRSGIVVQANAHPILRGNLIQDSREDGLVAIAQATPDLGSATEPGRNEFRNNNHYDINASAAKHMISAYGNTLRSYRIAGQVDTSIKTSTQVTNTSAGSASPPIPLSVSFDRSSSSRILHNSSGSQKQPLPQPAKTPPTPLVSVSQNQPISKSRDFPAPSGLTSNNKPLKVKRTHNRQIVTDKPDTPQLNYVQMAPVTVEFSAPKLKTSTPAQPPSTRRQKLPVASVSIQRLNSPKQSLPVESAPVQSFTNQRQQVAVGSTSIQKLNIPKQSLPVEPASVQPPTNQRQQLSVVSVPTQKLNIPKQSLPVEPASVQPPTNQRQQLPVVSVPTQKLNIPKQSLPVESAPVQPPTNQWQQLPVVSVPTQKLNTPKQSLSVESAPAVQQPTNQWQQLPVVEAAPIQNYNVPTNNSSNAQVPVPQVPQTVAVAYGTQTSPKTTNIGQINLRYRVVVAAGTQQDEELVKFIAPGAFHTVWRSQEVIQVGVFSSLYNADNMVKMLTKKGLKAVVEPIN